MSRGVNINLIQDLLKVAALEGSPPRSSCWGYKRPQAPLDQKEEELFWVLLSAWTFFAHFSSLPNIFTHKNTQKTHSSLLILHSSPKIQGIVLTPNLLLLGSTLWIWGLGVWKQLFSYYPHPSSLHLSLAFILLSLALII